MDNRQLRTAMVTMAISKLMGTILSDDGVEVLVSDRTEAFTKIFEWRNTLNMDMSIATRGATEGLWQVDLAMAMQPGWSDMVVATHAAHEMVLATKAPKKILFFNPDFMPAPFLQKVKFPETEIVLVNNQGLWNFEHFMRDEATEINGHKYYDVDYSVVDRSEIGQGEASGFDMIMMQAYDTLTDSEVLLNCVDALEPGGVLSINTTNNSGKIYRDDFWFHPYNEIHKTLKKCDGLMFHSSALYGNTVFVKN